MKVRNLLHYLKDASPEEAELEVAAKDRDTGRLLAVEALVVEDGRLVLLSRAEKALLPTVKPRRRAWK